MKTIMEIKNISKTYKNGNVEVKALQHIDMALKQRELVAVLGRSGSGKSTLLSIMGGLLDPSEGDVVLNGKSIFFYSENVRTALRRKEIGFVFQAYHLIPVLTVEENIALPQIGEDKQYVNELLKVLELNDRRKHFPNELSGGQQQRVAIARALINHPKIVLADEPTGNLDSRSEKNVMDVFRILVEKYGTTILLITHNENLTKMCDRVFYLEDGRLI
ncbi:ABC transporter ATP-binding protein [Lachnospiraceae bacterium MD308]|nr:ABC transporter ATP-binding protein [Lachnospiraceae bacterium MD308]